MPHTPNSKCNPPADPKHVVRKVGCFCVVIIEAAPGDRGLTIKVALLTG